MTTIVYSKKEGVIAYDSREGAGNLIITDNAQKCHEKNGRHFVMAGDSHDVLNFVAEYDENKPVSVNYGNEAMMIEGGEVFRVYVYDGLFKKDTVCDIEAIGSGAHFAIAALDHCSSAKEAVRYAMTRDSNTGGKVRTIRVK